jgi:hypothetical protein
MLGPFIDAIVVERVLFSLIQLIHILHRFCTIAFYVPIVTGVPGVTGWWRRIGVIPVPRVTRVIREHVLDISGCL